MLSPVDEAKIKDTVNTIKELQRDFETLQSLLSKVGEQITAESTVADMASREHNVQEQLQAKSEALQNEIDDLRKQLDRQHAQQKAMREQIRRGISGCFKDVFSAIDVQNPFDRAEQLDKDLKSATEKISQLEVERKKLQEEVASLQEINKGQQQTIQQLKDRIESDKKRLDVVPGELESARIEAQEELVRSLVLSVGVRQLGQLLQSRGRNLGNQLQATGTVEEQIGKRVVTFLAQQKLQPLHQPNELFRLSSESDLVQYELPPDVQFSTEQPMVVVLPGIVWKDKVLTKAKLREWDEEDDRERTQPATEEPIANASETERDREGTPEISRDSSAGLATAITDARSEGPTE